LSTVDKPSRLLTGPKQPESNLTLLSPILYKGRSLQLVTAIHKIMIAICNHFLRTVIV